jgi:hypothetical protein
MDTTAREHTFMLHADFGSFLQMAEYAFDSYNSPAEGSRWVEHPDGSRTAYLSANLIRLLYSGILMLEIR